MPEAPSLPVIFKKQPIMIILRLLIYFSIVLFLTGSCQFTNAQTKIMNTQTGYTAVNGIRMYYEIHGEGTPLVLIHGGGSTIQTTFGRVLPLFAKKFKVIAVELQAHGHTSDRNAPETFQQDADDVVALLQELSISKASFLG